MAPLCKLVKRGAVRANDLPLSNDLEAWPDSSVGRAPTYKVRGREFESRSGQLFSRTFTFKGRYREKILEFCLSKHGMSHENTNASLDEAISQKKMYTSVVHGQLSYRKYDDKICIEDNKESCYTQIDPYYPK